MAHIFDWPGTAAAIGKATAPTVEGTVFPGFERVAEALAETPYGRSPGVVRVGQPRRSGRSGYGSFTESPPVAASQNPFEHWGQGGRCLVEPVVST